MLGLECLFPIYIFVSEVLKDQGNSFLLGFVYILLLIQWCWSYGNAFSP